MSFQSNESADKRCDLLELTWGTFDDVVKLECHKDTRQWAYAWIEGHIARLCAGDKVGRIADLGGGGVKNYFAGRLSRYAREVMVVDKFGKKDEKKGNIHQVICDMETGLSELPDATIDIICSASALEHLTVEGQRNIFREIERVLKPGGYFCGTVSYITRLTEQNIALIKSDPAFKEIGSEVFGTVNIRENLLYAGVNDLDRVVPERFPGFCGFTESSLLADETLVYDFVGSYGDVRCLKDVDDLKLKWFECGIFFRKNGGKLKVRSRKRQNLVKKILQKLPIVKSFA